MGLSINAVTDLWHAGKTAVKKGRKYLTEETKDIFERLHNNPKKINQTLNIYNDIHRIQVNARLYQKGKTDYRKEIIKDIISSPNSDEYLSHYKKYEPFFSRHISDKNIIWYA